MGNMNYTVNEYGLKTVRGCDLDGYVAARLLELLNPGKVAVTKDPYNQFRIIANCQPEDLTYPEGWYFNMKNGFTNKHWSSTGQYETIGVYDPDGYPWTDAGYMAS